jgi:Tol biopolymer transport system component
MASVMVALVVACVAVLLAVSTKPAAAAFPGKNGDIAFSAEHFDTSTSQIFTIKPKGAAQEMSALTQAKVDGYVGVPTFSPDGKKIAFTSTRDGNAEDRGDSEIYVMDAAPEGPHNHPVKLTNNAYDDGSPDFSPDGRRIVYDTFSSGNPEIMVMSAKDGRGKKNLTHNPAKDYAPVFSPDGNMIAFGSDRDGRLQIWKMRADGTKPTRVTTDAPYYNYNPDWQPLP